MQLLEGSDTQLTFTISEITSNTTTPMDLADFDKVILAIRFVTGVVEFIGDVDDNTVTFDILSENTAKKAGVLSADVRGIKDAKKIRFNEATINGAVLPSVIVPAWVQ